MAETAIEWATDVWNPTTGCDRVSPGCANCYALTMAKRLKAMGQARYQRDGDPRTSGPGFGFTMHPGAVDLPLRWRKPRTVFVNSMSDLFHEDVTDEFLRTVFAVMASTEHTFQVLTKRPERARDFFAAHHWRCGLMPWVTPSGRSDLLHTFLVPNDFDDVGGIPLDDPPANIWMGVSIENARFTYRADVLRQIPAAVRFISAEPLLGSLFTEATPRARRRNREASLAVVEGFIEEGMTGDDASAYVRDIESRLPNRTTRPLDLTGIDWVIIGGESGPRSRPFHLEHAREIITAAHDQCWGCKNNQGLYIFNGAIGHADDEPCTRPALFVKQLGAKPVETMIDAWNADEPSGYDVPLKLRDGKGGGDMSEWPADLRIREFPRSAVPA